MATATPGSIFALVFTLAIGWIGAAAADESYLSGAIREASGLAPTYQFARQCADSGDISPTALEHFRNRLLSAIEEKYTLEFDETLVAEAYLTGQSSSSMPTIYPSSGRDRADNCATSTSLM